MVVEDFGEVAVDVNVFGEHVPDFGSAYGGGVDQDGFADVGE